MKKFRVTLSLVLAAAAAGTVINPAAARTAAGALPALAAATAAAPDCGPRQPLPGSGSKAAALLGGQGSQLELVRQQQDTQIASQGKLATAFPVPAAGDCAGLVLRRGDRPSFAAGRGAPPLGAADFLGSKRLPVSRTNLDAAWNRVRDAALPKSTAAPFARFAPGGGGEQLLAAVNAYANRHIRYVDDRQLYGRADYWADAATTLARGAGDCEDIAIAKMQLLAAAGVPRDDMYLTIARDLVRNADHAVLIVRMEGRHWLLDNGGDRVIDASDPLDYRPIFSFSNERRWLHGY